MELTHGFDIEFTTDKHVIAGEGGDNVSKSACGRNPCAEIKVLIWIRSRSRHRVRREPTGLNESRDIKTGVFIEDS